jgi:hypothetical protein
VEHTCPYKFTKIFMCIYTTFIHIGNLKTNTKSKNFILYGTVRKWKTKKIKQERKINRKRKFCKSGKHENRGTHMKTKRKKGIYKKIKLSRTK